VASAAAKRYARAVFELAQEQHRIEAWRRRLEAVRALTEIPALQAVLANRAIAGEDRARLLREVAGGSLDADGLNLAALLLENGRLEQVGDVLQEFESLVDAAEGRVRARAITAVELSDDERRDLERELAQRFGGKVRLETEVDPGILGGLVIRVGDHLVDASVRTRLQQLRRRLAVAGA
jgi:F-type H+-transporting ATPase subunit delta